MPHATALTIDQVLMAPRRLLNTGGLDNGGWYQDASRFTLRPRLVRGASQASSGEYLTVDAYSPSSLISKVVALPNGSCSPMQ